MKKGAEQVMRWLVNNFEASFDSKETAVAVRAFVIGYCAALDDFSGATMKKALQLSLRDLG